MELKDLGTIAVILIVAAIIISFGGTILQDVTETNFESVSVVGENHTTAKLTTEKNFLLNAEHRGKYGQGLSVSSIYSNSSSLCNANNYTVYPVNFSVTMHRTDGNATSCNCTTSSGGIACNVSYSYSGKTAASNVSDSGKTGMTNLADWTPTIAIVLAAAIVVGIILMSFRT